MPPLPCDRWGQGCLVSLCLEVPHGDMGCTVNLKGVSNLGATVAVPRLTVTIIWLLCAHKRPSVGVSTVS